MAQLSSAAETFIIKRKRYGVRKTFCALLFVLDLHRTQKKYYQIKYEKKNKWKGALSVITSKSFCALLSRNLYL